MTNAPVDPRLVEFVRQRRKATGPVDPKLVDFVRQRRAAKNSPVNVVGMPVLPGDADYERVQHENRVYQNTKEYGDPFEGSPGMIAKRFGEVVATGGKGVLPAAYDSTIGATARGLGRVAASVAEGTGLASKERADQTRAVMDTYAQNEARTAAQTPGGSVGSFVGPAALSAGMMLATRTPYAGALTGTGLGIYGLSSADQGMAEYRATRQQQGKDANPWEELAVGAGYGAAEILFERIGLNKTGAAIRSVGQNMADAVLRRDAKALAQIAMSTAESVGVNMTEEGATQYGQNIIDSTFDPNQDINEGVRSSMIGGGLQGLMFAGPGGALSGAYHGVRAARDAGRTAAAYGGAVVDAIRGPQADATQTPPAPVNSPTAQAAAARLRQQSAPSVTTTPVNPQPGAVPVTVTPTPVEESGPLIPPGQQPSEQDLADARAIIMRDPQIVTQPSRFRAEYLAARKRRAQPARPFAYTDNPDLATVLGADQIGLTNIRTRRGDANAAQRAESGGGAPGAVAVRGPDVPAAPTPAVQDRAVPPADQGRGVESAAVEPAPASPVDRGVGKVVGDQRAEVRNQPGDVGVDADSKGLSTEALFERRHRLAKPIKGKSGASIVGYRWMSQLEEGPTRDRRVSDWSMSQTSEPTGRSIVHLYLVQDESGKETLMGIGAAQKALGISESRLQSIAKREAEAQRNRARQDDQTAATIEKNAATTPEAADAEYRRVNDPSKMMWGTPEERVRVIQDRFNAALVLTKRGRFIRTGDAALIDTLSSRGWSVYDGKDSTPTPPPDPATLPAGPTGVEKYGIYSVRVRDRGTMYAVRTSERADGFGDSMFESVAEAKDYANDQRERDTANAEFRSREAAENERKEAAKAQRDAERSDTDGFADSLDPMRRGKVIASLAALVNIDGVVQSARDHVRAMVKSGSVELSTREVDKIKPMSRAAFNRADNRQQEAHERRVKEGGKITEYRINGYNLGKTAYEYAQHLVNRQSESQHPDPATLPRPQLVRLAKERGVDTKGTKKEIAERLKAQTASSPEQQTTTPSPATDAEKVIDRSTKIREHLNAAISKRKSPAIWFDHQLILEDGKYDVDEDGKRTKVQDLSGAGFLKNAREAYEAVKVGATYAGMNDAAMQLVDRVVEEETTRKEAEREEALVESEKQAATQEVHAAASSSVRDFIDSEVAKAKFKKQDAQVGDKTIAMSVFKGLGVDKRSAGNYIVTHLASGKRIDSYGTLRDAKAAIVRLSLIADFTGSEESMNKQVDKDTYVQEIRPLRDNVYAVTPAIAKMAGNDITATLAERLDSIADRAKERLEKRAKKQGGSITLNMGLNPEQLGTALRDTVDLSIVGAAKAAAAGVRAGRALTKVVDAAIAEMGRTVTPKVRAIIQKNVRKILAESGGDPDKFEKVVSDLYNAPVTKKDIRAQAKARKQAAASITNPGENAAPVSQADALRGRLKAAEQTGEKVAKSAAAKIVQATRQGYQRGRRDERRTAIANMQGVVNDIKRERGRLRSLAQFEKRAGEVAVKMTADDARRAQMIRDGIRKQVVQYARTLPKEVRGKLVGRIATADTPTKMIQTVRELQRELMRHDGREAWKWINRNTAPNRLKTLAGITNDVRKAVATFRAAAYNARNQLRDTDNLTEMARLRDQVVASKNAIAREIRTARSAYKEIRGLRGLNAIQAAQQVVKAIGKTKPAKAEKYANPEVWGVVRFWRGLRDIQNMLAEIEGPEGILQQLIYKNLERGWERYHSIVRDMTGEMERAFIRAGFDSLGDAHKISGYAGRGVTEKVMVRLGGENFKITLGDAISLLAHNTDPQTAALFATVDGQEVQRQQGTGVNGFKPTPNELLALRIQVDPDGKYLRLIADLKAIRAKFYPAVRRAKYELTGIEPLEVPDQWPRRRNMKHGVKAPELPETAAGFLHMYAENWGNLNERVQTTAYPIKLVDPITEMHEQIHMSAAIIALAAPVRDAANVWLQREVRDAVVSRFGVAQHEAVHRFILQNSGVDLVLPTRWARIASNMTSIFVTKNLSFNIGTWWANLTGAVRFLPFIKAKHLAKGFATFRQITDDDINSSGMLWDRYNRQGAARFSAANIGGTELIAQDSGLAAAGSEMRRALQNATRLDLGASMANMRRAANAGMVALNWIEKQTVKVAWAAYRAQANEEHPNWRKVDREKWVSDQVRALIAETQNSSRVIDMAVMPADMRGTPAAMATVLTSDVLKTRNRIRRAFRQSKRQGAKVLAAEMVASALAITGRGAIWTGFGLLVSSLFGGDEDDFERIARSNLAPEKMARRYAREFLSLIMPLGGSSAIQIIEGAVEGNKYKATRGIGELPAVEPMNDAIWAGIDAWNASVANANYENETKDVVLAWLKFVNAAASASGINPADPIFSRALREIEQTTEW